jgi:hypothetical protein
MRILAAACQIVVDEMRTEFDAFAMAAPSGTCLCLVLFESKNAFRCLGATCSNHPCAYSDQYILEVLSAFRMARIEEHTQNMSENEFAFVKLCFYLSYGHIAYVPAF